jgi:hypothetical protein
MSNINHDVQAQADDITTALRALQPNGKHRRSQLFSLLYPVIEEMLKKGVTQKSILEMLEMEGLKLHPSRFKELMAAEAMATAGQTTAEEDAA